ncbi:unnamed protein product [Symbiodinium necroappetens]|uniref:Uncharacterized protein n=1 Tax=Symbiodinium necroappetens TaxID=1628268 RepID=A0A812P675_9DINO|nr:unnamed protein product [Symbiodinium necroappetens]
MVASKGFEDLPSDVTIRCVAVLPIADAPQFRRACRRLSLLCGMSFSRTRARLGVRELRLVGGVAGDPRAPLRKGGQATRLTMELQPNATSAAKDLLKIKGSELEAVIDGVDRAASSLETQVSTAWEQVPTALNSQEQLPDSQRSTLHDWDSGGYMREAEVYAVIGGQLYLIGPAECPDLRWMMQMVDAEAQFASFQNARLYIADVTAEIQTSSTVRDQEVSALQRSNDFRPSDLINGGNGTSRTELESPTLGQGVRGHVCHFADQNMELVASRPPNLVSGLYRPGPEAVSKKPLCGGKLLFCALEL